MSTLFEHYVERVKKQQNLEVKTQTNTCSTFQRKGNWKNPDTSIYTWDQKVTDLIRERTGSDVCVIYKTITGKNSILDNYLLLQQVGDQLIVVCFQLHEEEIVRFVAKVSKHGMFYPFYDREIKNTVKLSGDCLETILSELPRYRLLTCTGTLTITNH